jgi:LmbE family N-acetylglucosaminyl deacetylase
MAVLAHPDDESFGMGGTLAMYARQGVAVHLVCATRGEAGEVDPAYLRGFHTIAERREAELRCASELLGLAGVHFLDYRDSGMPGAPDNQHAQALINAPIDEVAAKVTTRIRQVKPQVVITSDPIGGYRHPDHIHIQQATVKAFHAAGIIQTYPDSLPAFQPQRLFYHIFPRDYLRILVFLLRLTGKDPRKWGRNGDIDLLSIAEVSFPTHAVINYRPVARLREQASACHASQGGHLMARGPIAMLRRWFSDSSERFMQAYPAPDKKKRNDLFANL